MTATTLRYLMSLAVSQNLETRLITAVTVYLYEDLDTKIYIEILEGFAWLEAKSRNM